MRTSEGKITKKDLRGLFLRSLPMEASFSYESMMSMAYAYCMKPIITKLYDDPEKQKDAMQRHIEFFNCTSACTPFILGASAAMEEQNAMDPQYDTCAINQVKSDLMGPLASLGDTIFWGVLRMAAAGIGISLALQGSYLGPVLFVLLFNVPNFLFRYFGAVLGYEKGPSLIRELSQSGVVERLTWALNILGLVIIGGMTAFMVRVQTPLTIAGVSVQAGLDHVLPGLAALLFTLLLYWLMKKNVSSNWLIAGCLLLGVAAEMCGILA